MLEQILEQNGLTKNEVRLYITILAAGEISVGRLATKSHIKRTTIYSTLEHMKEKHLISMQKKKNVLYISAVSPKVLVERFKQSALLAENILPELLDLAYSSPLKPRVRFYEGLDGLQEILLDFSVSSKSPVGFTDYSHMPTQLLHFIQTTVIPNRKRLRTKARFIAPKTTINEKIKQSDNLRFSEHALMHMPTSYAPIELLLYEETKVAFLSFSNAELFGIIIDSKAIYSMLYSMFQVLWNSIKDN